MTLNLAQAAASLIATLGYGGLAAGLVVDSAGIPIPSEILLPLSGALARQGQFNLALVIAVGTLAQTLGGVLAYWLGRVGGLPLAERYGKYVLFSSHELKLTDRLFERYGQWLALIGRCLPVVRSYIGFPAGLAEMNFYKFAAATLLGSFVWSTFLAYLGFYFNDKLAVIDHAISRFGLLTVALLIVGLIWYLKRRLTNKA